MWHDMVVKYMASVGAWRIDHLIAEGMESTSLRLPKYTCGSLLVQAILLPSVKRDF